MKNIISRNLTQLRGRIAKACELYDRDADNITIVAVTKSHPPPVIRTAVAAGIHEIGESKVQEAEPKIMKVGAIARFHLVGHLQTNKAKKAVRLFDVIQSIDSFKLAREINRQAELIDRTIECYIEVNCSGESQKFGVAADECLDLVRQVNALERIKLTGLMTIGPLTDDQDAIRKAFRLCRGQFLRARDIVGDEFDTLSMGMSDDFPLAIAEGSTMIRIGTALFGPRQQDSKTSFESAEGG